MNDMRAMVELLVFSEAFKHQKSLARGIIEGNVERMGKISIARLPELSPGFLRNRDCQEVLARLGWHNPTPKKSPNFGPTGAVN